MIVLVWVHLLAATVWVGGMLFLTLVLVPVFKAESFAGERRALFVTLARRFRVVAWASIGLLITTGATLLRLRTESLLNPSSWPTLLKVKLVLVTLLLGVTMTHDFWLGPRIAELGRHVGPRSWRDQFLLRLAPWVARGALVLALAVLLAAVTLVRS